MLNRSTNQPHDTAHTELDVWTISLFFPAHFAGEYQTRTPNVRFKGAFVKQVMAVIFYAAENR